VPTVIYGGLTVLGVITGGNYGAPAPPNLAHVPARRALLYAGGTVLAATTVASAVALLKRR
jgi:hypothetical protein